jgi:lipopolysaccharide biosynthesis protein
LRLFRNIVFPDPVNRSREDSLEKKMEAHLMPPTVFFGTGFNNPDTVFPRSLRPGRPRRDLTIGIHLHLYHISMAHEIVRYLQEFPTPFDLYVTITETDFSRTIRNLFSRSFLPGVQTARILHVPNRGRDVAPWILGMRPYQAAYDLFCHIHSKESAHMGFGDEWRKYLFDNLIQSEAALEIIDFFEEYPDLGCLFPAIHAKLRQFMTDNNISACGVENESEQICGLLRRMDMRGELCRSELFFSAGTMLWYRPQALRQMFTFDLSLAEFAEEPIGVGGTLAHAIERLPAVVCARNGYAAYSLTHS